MPLRLGARAEASVLASVTWIRIVRLDVHESVRRRS